MKLKISVFAIYREMVGKNEIELELDKGAAVADLVRELENVYPRLSGHMDSLMVAVNAVYVEPHYELKDGDEVALIPPISGGHHG
ncbi:MAG: MoaD/ThiS family protein [Chloroflexi bacterium]|nr:MoaD/ThiS family protein [Chloroflexota bacterium]